MTDLVPITRALISVSDKAGLLPLWRDRDTVQFGVDPRRAVALGGLGQAAAVISLLDGSRDRETLIGTAQAAELPRAHPAAAQAAGMHWAIQVGTFGSARDANAAAALARRSADGGEVHIEQLKLNGRPTWRAQVVGLTAPGAQNACAALSRHKTACFVIRPEQHQLASR